MKKFCNKKKVKMMLTIFITIVLALISILLYGYYMNNSSIIVEKVSDFKNPLVPNGFKKIETENASWELENGYAKGWNNGLVIEDKLGNQFVWVPVDIETTKFDERDLKYNYVYNKNQMNPKNKEEMQILKYGGFYVARYEAGIPDDMMNVNEFSAKTNNIDGIPVSKKNQIAWNYIDWNLAKRNAKRMYYNEYLESDLISTKQWCTIMNWVSHKGYNIENSIEWGNYSNNNFRFTGYYSIDYGKTYMYGENKIKQTYNMILSTGATERNMANNIYDLAGNVSEFADVHKWINGEYGEQQSYRNWGGYYDNISHYSASSSMSISSANSRQGFRVVLYLN